MKLTEEKRFFYPAVGVTVMKREGFWRYATPPVNIRGVPLPFTMIYLFICPFPQNNLLDLHRHHFIFRYSRPFRLDCQDDLYSHFQHSERGHRLRSSMVVSPPYGITTRLDWPRLNSGVFMSGKNYRYSAPGIATGMPVTVHDTIVCNDRHAIREGRLFS